MIEDKWNWNAMVEIKISIKCHGRYEINEVMSC